MSYLNYYQNLAFKPEIVVLNKKFNVCLNKIKNQIAGFNKNK